MKKFEFSLDRVLEWRRTQARQEESKLERLYADLHALDANQAALHVEREQTESEVRASREVTGQDLGAVHAIQEHVKSETRRIAQLRRGCEQQIAVQGQIVRDRRQKVKLFEKLKEQRFAGWSQEWDRELAQQAEESHFAKWNRGNIQ